MLFKKNGGVGGGGGDRNGYDGGEYGDRNGYGGGEYVDNDQGKSGGSGSDCEGGVGKKKYHNVIRT